MCSVNLVESLFGWARGLLDRNSIFLIRHGYDVAFFAVWRGRNDALLVAARLGEAVLWHAPELHDDVVRRVSQAASGGNPSTVLTVIGGKVGHTGEGLPTIPMNIVADGNSTLEHNVPADVFYEDVLQFFGQSATNYTPTLVVTYGGLAGDPYWRQATDVWANPLMVHTPPDRLRADTSRVVKAPESNFVDDDNAREANKLAKAGVLVSIGAHGQQAGIGAHWELWSFVRGGMTPMQALEAGTIKSARSLGMAKGDDQVGIISREVHVRRGCGCSEDQ